MNNFWKYVNKTEGIVGLMSNKYSTNEKKTIVSEEQFNNINKEMFDKTRETNWVDEVLQNASKAVKEWPSWMRRPEVRCAYGSCNIKDSEDVDE